MTPNKHTERVVAVVAVLATRARATARVRLRPLATSTHDLTMERGRALA